MSSYTLTGNNNPDPIICKVGYALNAKKLRKSTISAELQIQKRKQDTVRWNGGGLSDIVSEDMIIEGVSFSPFKYVYDGSDNNSNILIDSSEEVCTYKIPDIFMS